MMSHDRELGARHYNMHSKILCVNRPGLCRNMNSEDLFISEGRCNEIAIRCHGVTVSQCHSVTMSHCHGLVIEYHYRSYCTHPCERILIDSHWSPVRPGFSQMSLDTPTLRECNKSESTRRRNEEFFSHTGWNRFIF